ncbi:C-reactive protein isoform X2 [Bombina bombina]|nr:C-reactive protein isoform X2 [Bombina bombina]XP_053552085.1 C-reactive protein isoform X2 [Bombina bombina]
MDGKVFLFPKATSTAYVTLKPALNDPLNKLTICLRSYTEILREHSLISIATPGSSNDNAFILYAKPPNACAAFVGQEENLFKINPDTLDWKHTCVTWDSDTGVVQLWINGKLYPRKVSKKGFSFNAKTSIILGQEQDSFGGGFDIKQSFVGEITDLHMWDYVLEPLDIQKALLGFTSTNGNVISWNALQYEMKGNVFVQPKIESQAGYTNN